MFYFAVTYTDSKVIQKSQCSPLPFLVQMLNHHLRIQFFTIIFTQSLSSPSCSCLLHLILQVLECQSLQLSNSVSTVKLTFVKQYRTFQDNSTCRYYRLMYNPLLKAHLMPPVFTDLAALPKQFLVQSPTTSLL